MRQFIQTVVGKLFYWRDLAFHLCPSIPRRVWLCSNTLENWIESTALLNGLVLLSVVILCPLTATLVAGKCRALWKHSGR